MRTLILLDRFLGSFPKFRLFIVESCFLIRLFWLLYENYSMLWLNRRGNDFIAA